MQMLHHVLNYLIAYTTPIALAKTILILLKQPSHFCFLIQLIVTLCFRTCPRVLGITSEMLYQVSYRACLLCQKSQMELVMRCRRQCISLEIMHYGW